MKRDKKVIIFVITILALFFLCAMLVIGANTVKNTNALFIFKNLIIICYSLCCSLSIVALIKYLNVISIVLIVINCIFLFGQLYFFDNRLYYKLLIILMFISLIYTFIVLIIKLIKKARNVSGLNVSFLNAILPSTIIIFSYTMKTFYLFDNIEITSNNVWLISFIVSIVISLIVLINYLIFRKDRSNKKEYIGGMMASIFAPMLLSLLLCYGTINNINYAFDTVYETKEYYEVVNKGKTPSSKGGTGYYIIVNIEDEEFRMKVEKVVYFEYEIGDNILLYKYNGALGYSYYEYQMNSIYIYNNE